MNPLDVPFNLKILKLTKEKLFGLRSVRSLDIMDGATNNLHPDGLYSVETFGKIGQKRRKMAFSFIDIKIPVFHPLIFRRLGKMKILYQEIMAGETYGKWNNELKDFERSNAIDGETGYAFFMSHWQDIDFARNNSSERDQTIALIAKAGDAALTDKVVVMPAGYRDIEYENNRITENEINSFYKKLLSISNVINEPAVKVNPSSIDRARYGLQIAFNDLYNYIESLVRGKRKLVLDKWATRATFNGTRNVLTPMVGEVRELHGRGEVNFNSTQIGIYQAAKAILPVAQFLIRNKILNDIFVSVDQPVRLINKKTLKSEEVRLRPEIFDYWGSNEGVAKLINTLAVEGGRHLPVEVSDHYLALVYKDDGFFKIFYDIDELPAGFDRKNVKPITLIELAYIPLYREIRKYAIELTRYPIIGIGSIYPGQVYLRTTVRAKKLRELGIDWAPLSDEFVAEQYPIDGLAFINTMIPHMARLKKLDADFDGDTGSGVIPVSDEAVEENRVFMMKKKAYVNTDGKAIASISTPLLDFIFYNLSME
jgi:hypothetical protein